MNRQNPKLALLIASYNRPVDLLRQIYAMVYTQTYKNTHLFVAVKGVTESVFMELILPQVQPLIDSGKLTIGIAGNTNQMINLLDTVRNRDIDGYDLFLKIDDDDFYHPEYLQIVASALQMCSPGTSTAYSGEVHTGDNKDGFWRTYMTFPEYSYHWFSGYGDMLGLSRKMIDHMFEVEKNPDILREDAELLKWKDGQNIGWREDRYYYEMACKIGPVIDIGPLCERKGIKPVIIGGHTEQNSFTRSADYRRSKFFNKVISFRNNPRPPREWIVELEDGKLYKAFDGILHLIPDEKEVRRYKEFDFEKGKITMFGGVTYLRHSDGKYYVEPTQ